MLLVLKTGMTHGQHRQHMRNGGINNSTDNEQKTNIKNTKRYCRIIEKVINIDSLHRGNL